MLYKIVGGKGISIAPGGIKTSIIFKRIWINWLPRTSINNAESALKGMGNKAYMSS